MKGIKAALCFHSALHSAPMLFFPWPLLPCAREEFDKVTPGPCYLFLSLHLPSLSQILIVCLAGLGCLSSHQWGHTFGLPSHFLPCTCLVIYFAVETASEPAGLIQSSTSLDWCTGQSHCFVQQRSQEWRGGRVLQQERRTPMSCNLLLSTHPLLLPHWT